MEKLNQTRRKFKVKLEKKQDTSDAIPGLLGKGDGTVVVPTQAGMVYYRAGNEESPGTAYNSRVPLIDNLPIFVGYDPITDPDRRLFQVLSIRQTAYTDAGNTPIPEVGPHGSTHEFGGGDDVYVEWRRIMGLRVGRPALFVVTVDPGYIYRAGTWILAPVGVDTVDLTAEQAVLVGTQAQLILISLDSTGAVAQTNGAIVASPAMLTIANCPTPPAGNIPLAAVRIYATQTAIGDTPSAPDIIDLRFPTYDTMRSQAHNILSSTHLDSTTAACVLGDIITGQAGPVWARLAHGTQYQTLQAGATTPTWGAVNLAQATAITGILPVGNGGTGLAGGTSGGVPYYSGAATITSSAALTQYAVVLGGGAGGAPTTVSGLGTAGYALLSNGAGAAPTWQANPAAGWGLTGNSGTSVSTNFLGTIDDVGLRLRVNRSDVLGLYYSATLDQSCTSMGGGGSGSQPYGQSFTCGTSGTLAYVELAQDGIPASDVTLRSGEDINGALLATGALAIPCGNIGGHAATRIYFDTVVQLTATSQYTIRDNFGTNALYEGAYDGYAGGKLYRSGAWYDHYDAIFTVYINPSSVVTQYASSAAYMISTVSSTGSATLDLVGTSPTFTFSKATTFADNVTVTSTKWLGLGSAAGRLTFTDAATDTAAFSDCNVGIGTPTPGALLDIQGTAGIAWRVDPTGSNAWYIDATNADRLKHTGSIRLAPTGDVTFYQNSVAPFTSVGASAVANTLYLNAGNVGICSVPSSRLDVNGVDSTTSYIVARFCGVTSGYGAYLQFTDGATYNYAFGTTPTTGDFTWYSGRYPGAAGTLRMTLDQAGALTVTGAFGCNGVAAQTKAAHIANPSGGATVDAEARTAINAILVVLENFGFSATS